MTENTCSARASLRCAPPTGEMLEAYQTVHGLTWQCRCGKVWQLVPNEHGTRLAWAWTGAKTAVAAGERRTKRAHKR